MLPDFKMEQVTTNSWMGYTTISIRGLDANGPVAQMLVVPTATEQSESCQTSQ